MKITTVRIHLTIITVGILNDIQDVSTVIRLKLYNRVPPNVLVLYTGTIVTEDGKEKKVTIDFDHFKPINASLYFCDNKFHTEALNELLESDDKFGFIVYGW